MQATCSSERPGWSTRPLHSSTVTPAEPGRAGSSSGGPSWAKATRDPGKQRSISPAYTAGWRTRPYASHLPVTGSGPHASPGLFPLDPCPHLLSDPWPPTPHPQTSPGRNCLTNTRLFLEELNRRMATLWGGGSAGAPFPAPHPSQGGQALTQGGWGQLGPELARDKARLGNGPTVFQRGEVGGTEAR